MRDTWLRRICHKSPSLRFASIRPWSYCDCNWSRWQVVGWSTPLNVLSFAQAISFWHGSFSTFKCIFLFNILTSSDDWHWTSPSLEMTTQLWSASWRTDGGDTLLCLRSWCFSSHGGWRNCLFEGVTGESVTSVSVAKAVDRDSVAISNDFDLISSYWSLGCNHLNEQ